jgi:hypothetical protein
LSTSHPLRNRTTENIRLFRVPDGATLGIYGLGCIGLKVWRNARVSKQIDERAEGLFARKRVGA